MPGPLIQIDIDPCQIGMNYPVTVGIEGDAASILRDLIEGLPATITTDWGDSIQKARTIRHPKPEWLIETLRQTLPDDAIVVTDACEMGFRMQTDFPSYGPRTFFYPSNYIALGWGFAASLGAAVAKPNAPVVSVSGDGGFVMACQELATAVRYQLHVLVIVHNDQTYGAIKNLQRSRHDCRFHDTNLNNPDFVELARSFGVSACRVDNSHSFQQAIERFLEHKGPALIEVPDLWRNLRV
ncbi:MAG: thiamine pyrophosphate-binding protein [Planctomycetes bacterium]|nr:thiamine pyrophosphate-binding protein [Planctomycetota bacterium]